MKRGDLKDCSGDSRLIRLWHGDVGHEGSAMLDNVELKQRRRRRAFVSESDDGISVEVVAEEPGPGWVINLKMGAAIGDCRRGDP